MANNSIKPGTKVAWYNWHKNGKHKRLLNGLDVAKGIVVAQSRQGYDCVIVEWDDPFFPISIENVDDLIEIK